MGATAHSTVFTWQLDMEVQDIVGNLLITMVQDDVQDMDGVFALERGGVLLSENLLLVESMCLNAIDLADGDHN